jgi:hypothetical protein
MSIKQFNGSYVSNEDRLLFRFNTSDDSEYRFWLTRRITLFFLAATDHLVEKQLEKSHSKQTAKAITEFQNETAREKVDFTSAYQAVTKFPLGADPVLLSDVRCTLLMVNQQAVMSLDLVLHSGGQINLKLVLPTLQAMRVLLERLVKQAHWDQVLPNIASPVTGEAEPISPVTKINPGQVH